VGNKVLARSDVKALRDGACVWLENEPSWKHWDGVYSTGRETWGLRPDDDNDARAGGWMTESVIKHLGKWFRVWSLPQPPTEEELVSNPWPEVHSDDPDR